MSRSTRRRSGRAGRSGRPYQPLPERRNPWLARFLIVVVAVLLVFGSLALFSAPN